MDTQDESVSSTSTPSSAGLGRPDEYYEELDGGTLNLQRRKAPPTPIPTTIVAREPTVIIDPVQRLNEQLNRKFRPDLVRSTRAVHSFIPSRVNYEMTSPDYTEIELVSHSSFSFFFSLSLLKQRGQGRILLCFLFYDDGEEESTEKLISFSRLVFFFIRIKQRITTLPLSRWYSMEALGTFVRAQNMKYYWIGSTNSACSSAGDDLRSPGASANRFSGSGHLRRSCQTDQITAERESTVDFSPTEDLQPAASTHRSDSYTCFTDAWPRDVLRFSPSPTGNDARSYSFVSTTIGTECFPTGLLSIGKPISTFGCHSCQLFQAQSSGPTTVAREPVLDAFAQQL